MWLQALNSKSAEFHFANDFLEAFFSHQKYVRS